MCNSAIVLVSLFSLSSVLRAEDLKKELKTFHGTRSAVCASAMTADEVDFFLKELEGRLLVAEIEGSFLVAPAAKLTPVQRKQIIDQQNMGNLDAMRKMVEEMNAWLDGFTEQACIGAWPRVGQEDIRLFVRTGEQNCKIQLLLEKIADVFVGIDAPASQRKDILQQFRKTAEAIKQFRRMLAAADQCVTVEDRLKAK